MVVFGPKMYRLLWLFNPCLKMPNPFRVTTKNAYLCSLLIFAMKPTPTLDIKQFLYIKNAHLNNLKNIDVVIPKNKLVVITGVSGSGKSSLAFDTIYAEGQRRYVESLSSYARQFLGKLEKPKVDDIKGLAPSIAIQQKVISSNPRSTVGTTTEIYDYLKLMFARIGRTFSPVSGQEVKKDQVSDVVNYLQQQATNDAFLLMVKLPYEDQDFKALLAKLRLLGFSKLEIQGQLTNIEDLESFGFVPEAGTEIGLVIDRFVYSADEIFEQRFADSVQLAFYEGQGECILKNTVNNQQRVFSNKFELDGIIFNEPNMHYFSFNNPYGACPSCEGYGQVVGIDSSLVVPQTSLSIYEDAVQCWRGDSMSEWKNKFIAEASKLDFPIHKPYKDLSAKDKKLLWQGNGKKSFPCLDNFFAMLEGSLHKIQSRVMLSRYRGKTLCPSCQGARLRPETEYVKVAGYNIQSLINMPLDELLPIMETLELNPHDQTIAKRLLHEIISRLGFMVKVGLGYLSLNRTSNTLSGGESQRINLATSLGSSLVGSIYILDEPSIGLHSHDTENLIEVLQKLRDLGNSVIVVEHDEDIMKAADYIIDIGPEAGTFGGNVVFEGDYKALQKSKSLTAKYLNHKFEIPLPKTRRVATNFIDIKGARANNLKNIDVKIPLQNITVVTGVSGSGKSSLLKNILTPAIEKALEISHHQFDIDSIAFDKTIVQSLELIDQNPLGKSTRSNPVTYIKAYDDMRELMTKQALAVSMGLKSKHFSFNVEGGRCETCQGEGHISVSMQFMADIELLCEDCQGQRFKSEILEVRFQEKSIFDLLSMTIDEALSFFQQHKQNKIAHKLQSLHEVGLGYLQLGQSTSTLSGGEAQRLKLASYLVKGSNSSKTLFIFDEPSTGLHFHDVQKLLKSFNALVDLGHSVLIIEHHLDIIKCADWIIEMGPMAGKHGGEIIFQGLPEALAKDKKSKTAKYLAEKL
jgi:excinuclease ABC subunit A